MNYERMNKFNGCIFGLAIGDALGYQVEFLRLNEIKRRYGLQGITDIGRGIYSDDTQQTLCIARSLIKYAHGDANQLMEEMARELADWSISPHNNRAPGRTSMSACRKLVNGTYWKESGLDSESCGSAMRAAPIGLVYHDNEQRLIEIAINSSVITHANPTAIAAAVGAALAVAYAYRNEDIENFIEYIVERTEMISVKFADKIKAINTLLELDPEKAFEIIGRGLNGHETVAGALYAFLRSPNDYRKTILTAANTEGDSDSFACIAGAISGAYNDIEAIPKEWLDKIENRECLGRISHELSCI